MAETEEDPKANQSPLTPSAEQSPLFLEVVCKASGKARRFSVGTEAGFAVGLINKKLRDETPVLTTSYIEAIKEDEEPISFGPSSILVDYGPGWKLQTVIDPQEPGFAGALFRDSRRRIGPAYVKGTNDSDTMHKNAETSISVVYVGKILSAFVLLFVIGAVFTLLLENLPQLILYINSSL